MEVTARYNKKDGKVYIRTNRRCLVVTVEEADQLLAELQVMYYGRCVEENRGNGDGQ